MFLSLRARFVALMLLGITLALLAISVSVFQYRAQIAQTERLGHGAEVAAALDQLFAHVLQASNTSRRFVLSDDPVQLEAYRAAVGSIPPVVARLGALTQEQSEFAAEFDNLKYRIEHKLAHLDEILKLHSQADVEKLRLALISSDGLERLEAPRTSVAAFRIIDYGHAGVQVEQLRIGVLVQFAIVILLIFCGAVWAAILGNETIRNLLVPVSSMIAQVQRIAAGDFRETLPVMRRDEIGQLAEQINHMTERLHTTHEEREQARADLAEERQNLVDALEALDEGFAAYDRDGRLLQCNDKFLEYFPEIAPIAERGVPYEDLLRKRAESGSEPSAVDDIEKFVRDRLKDAQSPSNTRECTLSDGRVLQRSSYRTRNGGRVAVYVDMTEIKRAETSLLELNRDLDARVRNRTDDLNAANEQLRRLNAEMGALIVSAPVAIVALSPRRIVTTWNPAAIELTGLEIADVEPGLRNLLDDENAADFAAFLERVYGGQSPSSAEFRLRHQDSKEIEASVSASVLSDEMGKPIGAILIIADLTEARALQH